MFYQFPSFGPAFSQCFTKEFVGTEILTGAEKAAIEKVAEKRAKDFSTGRLCARKALENLGFTDVELLIGVNRQPLWPDEVAGSISHSQSLAGAIVSRTSDVLSLGLDIETIGGVKHELWNSLFSIHEQNLLTGFNDKEQRLYSTVLFSLKESFYKLQYPFTGMVLEFTDVEIGYSEGNFRFYSNKEFINKMPPLGSVAVQWIEFEDQVITLCHLNKSQ